MTAFSLTRWIKVTTTGSAPASSAVEMTALMAPGEGARVAVGRSYLKNLTSSQLIASQSTIWVEMIRAPAPATCRI